MPFLTKFAQNWDAGHVNVARAITELRAGRPVVITSGRDAIWALSVEAAGMDGDEPFPTDARAILSGPRLEHLGRPQFGPGSMPAGGLTLDELSGFVTDPDGDAPPDLRPASALEATALTLTERALVLPVAITGPIVAGDGHHHIARVAAEDVARYRDDNARDLSIVARAPVPLDDAPDSEVVIFHGGDGFRDQIAIIVGGPDPATPVLVRLHSACLTGDLFGSLKCDCGDQLRGAIRHMADEGGGVLLYLDQEGRGTGIANKIRAYRLQADGHDTFAADRILGYDTDHRRFDFAAAMLKTLGFTSVKVLSNNPAKIAALKEAGLDVVSTHRVNGRLNEHNTGYLEAKRDQAGHLIPRDLQGDAAE